MLTLILKKYFSHLYRTRSHLIAFLVIHPGFMMHMCIGSSNGLSPVWLQAIHYLDPLQWRHNELDCVSNHQPHDCLLNWISRCRSEKTSRLRVTGLCAGNSPVIGEFPAQRASNAENVSIWWRHHVIWPTVNWSFRSKRKTNLNRNTNIIYLGNAF